MQKKPKLIILLVLIIIVLAYFLIEKTKQLNNISPLQLKAQAALDKSQLKNKSPAEALSRLKAGNQRFVNEELKNADYSKLVDSTASAQHPAALVLSCIDSRVPPEIIFDQGIGNIFVSRIAAEVINPDIIAGMEYATAVTGSKLIVILGHGNCGAVSAACKQVKLGHITALLNKIQPAVIQAEQQMPNRTCKELTYINQIAINNVKNIVAEIPKKSPIIKKLVDKGQIKIIGAMYDIDSGKVDFFDPETN